MEAAKLLGAYLSRHNAGVRSGDFSGLADVLAPEVEMRFEGIELGPFLGVAPVLEAFRKNPPDDELVLHDPVLGDGELAEASYTGVRAGGGGRLRIRAEDGRITVIEITVRER